MPGESDNVAPVGIKRERPDDDAEGEAKAPPRVGDEDYDVDDFDEENLDNVLDQAEQAAKKGGRMAPQRFCPYLDSINRHILDFDFEKVCCVSNSHLNVYACLVCGKYFQGRARASPAYFHSLEHNHHVFMKLDTGKVYCIPDNYEVLDSSLADIKHNLDPTYNPEYVSKLDMEVKYSRGIDGTEFIPGTVGLNNLKNTAYLNVIIQALTCVSDLRDYFLLPSNYAGCKNLLVQRFGELLRKIWNPSAFKGQVSPHELFQAISVESNRKYRPDIHADPSEFLNWFLNSLHRGLGGSKGPTIISRVFQGKVRIESRRAKIKKAEDAKSRNPEEEEWDSDVKPFLHLTLDLPPTPLYADSSERNIIPQVPLLTILHKFDGSEEQNIRGMLKRYRLKALPPYIIITIRRFNMNTQFQVEKNPTIVSFPIKNLDLREFLDPEDVTDDTTTRYDLVSNICHEGLVTKATGTNEVHDKGIAIKEGVFRAQILNKAQEQWFQIDDLHIQEILPQVVSISEAYIQIYERSDLTAKRAEAKARSGLAQAVKEESTMDV